MRETRRPGQRCIVPAVQFDESWRESGKRVEWRFRHANGHPPGLAALWTTWVVQTLGEAVERDTRLTVNGGHPPMMTRMQKPDPMLPPDRQGNRSIVAIAPADIERRFLGSVEAVRQMLAAPAVELI